MNGTQNHLSLFTHVGNGADTIYYISLINNFLSISGIYIIILLLVLVRGSYETIYMCVCVCVCMYRAS